jgi:transposase
MIHKSQDYKLSVVKHYLVSDKTQEEVCEIFGCSSRSLMRWVERYENTGSIERKNRKPVAYKVKKEHLKFIVKELKSNPTITMEDLLALLKNKFDELELSRRHLAQVVKDNYISLKQTRIRHEPEKRFGKQVNINKNLKEFYKEIKKYSIDDIICIDETSINSLQKRQHCYSEVGKRCTITTTSQEVFKRYTAIMAISSKGMVGWKLYEKGGMDSERLIDFLNEYVTTKYKDKLIILDNASCHRNDRVKIIDTRTQQSIIFCSISALY